MPARIFPLATNEIYHVLNRGTGSIPIFKTQYDYQKFIELMLYYQNSEIPIRYSQFLGLTIDIRNQILKEFAKNNKHLVEIIAYCLMPTHFHLLLRQLMENGIEKFSRKISDSYSHYFNIKTERKGGLFEGRFQATRIASDQQLLHVSRYIHLNPYSSFVIKDITELENYPFSSFPEYIKTIPNQKCQKEIILNQFKDPEGYKKFVYDQSDYQRTLDQIKHQTFE